MKVRLPGWSHNSCSLRSPEPGPPEQSFDLWPLTSAEGHSGVGGGHGPGRGLLFILPFVPSPLPQVSLTVNVETEVELLVSLKALGFSS